MAFRSTSSNDLESILAINGENVRTIRRSAHHSDPTIILVGDTGNYASELGTFADDVANYSGRRY